MIQENRPTTAEWSVSNGADALNGSSLAKSELYPFTETTSNNFAGDQ
jgi:hypothetical protein